MKKSLLMALFSLLTFAFLSTARSDESVPLDDERIDAMCGQTYEGCVINVSCQACICRSSQCVACDKVVLFKRCGGNGAVACSDLTDPCNCGTRKYYTGESCASDADCFCDGDFTTQANCTENACQSTGC